MRRPAIHVLAAAVLSAWTVAASPVLAAPRSMSALELRDQFTQCGFEIANARANATNPYIVVRDPGAAQVRGADYRIVMAIVFADSAAATAAHQKAHFAAEQRLGERWPYSDDNGPQLLVGYGASVWRGNVAVVQTKIGTLASLYSYDEQTGEARVARPELMELGFDSSLNGYGVDRDIVSCLEDAPFATTTEPAGVYPVFMPARPF